MPATKIPAQLCPGSGVRRPKSEGPEVACPSCDQPVRLYRGSIVRHSAPDQGSATTPNDEPGAGILEDLEERADTARDLITMLARRVDALERRHQDVGNLVEQCPDYCEYRAYRDHDLLLGLLTDPRVLVCIIDGIMMSGDYVAEEDLLPLPDIESFIGVHNWPHPDAAQYLGGHLDDLRMAHLKTVDADEPPRGHALWDYGLELPDGHRWSREEARQP